MGGFDLLVMRTIILLALFLLPLEIFADQPRYSDLFTSKNGSYDLKLITPYDGRPQEWSLIESSTKRFLYRIKADIATMTVLVSDDGRYVVAVDDYSEQDDRENPTVLQFFGYGKLLCSYRLGDLLANPKVISVSASHFRWLLQFETKEGKLNFKTYELDDFVIDATTGKILSREKDARLDGDAIYVTGAITSLGGNSYQIKVRCLIKGSIPIDSTVRFVSENKYITGDAPWGRLIKNGRLVETNNVLINSCSNR